MSYLIRSLTRRILAIITMLLVVLSLGILGPVMARPSANGTAAQTEPQAGTWKTWVLKSSDQFLMLAVT